MTVGSTISHYKILGELGRGGLGRVYKAFDVRLERQVAIKVLDGADRDPEKAARLVREARAAAALRHPNICEVYEVDEWDGKPFIVMPVIEGETLTERLRRGPLDFQEAVDLLAPVADGLAVAHRQGTIHRDIKSTNLMVERDGRGILLDFGIAFVSGSSRLTVEGTTLGTPYYMSPEQAEGGKVDERSDIWSLGVVLYEAVTGQLPFEGDYDLSVLYAVTNSEPVPPSGLRDGVPPGLEAVILKALQKDPARRYQTAQELAEALRGAIEAGAPTLLSRLRFQPLSRSQTLSYAGVAVLIASIAAGGALFLSSPRTTTANQESASGSSEAHVAVLPFETPSGAEEDKKFADAAFESLTSSLSQLQRFQDNFWIVPASEIRGENVTSARQARQIFSVNYVITGSVEQDGTARRITLNLIDGALRRQLDSRVVVAHGAMWETRNDLAEAALNLMQRELAGDAKEALEEGGASAAGAYELVLEAQAELERYDRPESVSRAVEILRQALDRDPAYATAHATLAQAYWRRFRLTKNTEDVNRALEHATRAVELEPLMADAHLSLGLVLAGTNDADRAIAEFEEARKLDPLHAAVHQQLAGAYRQSGRTQEAEQAFSRAIELRPKDWSIRNAYASFLAREARYDEAAQVLRDALPLSPDNALLHRNLGGVSLLLGKFDESISELQTSIRIQPSAKAYSNLGAAFYYKGNFEDAVRAMEAMVDEQSRSYSDWGNLADAYRWSQGRQEAAKAAYERAIDLAKTRLQEVDASDPDVRLHIALYSAKLGRIDVALAEMQKISTDAIQGDSQMAFFAAQVYELAGNRERALEALRWAVNRGHSAVLIENDPELRQLRRDPRYPATMEAGAVRGSASQTSAINNRLLEDTIHAWSFSRVEPQPGYSTHRSSRCIHRLGASAV